MKWTDVLDQTKIGVPGKGTVLLQEHSSFQYAMAAGLTIKGKGPNSAFMLALPPCNSESSQITPD